MLAEAHTSLIRHVAWELLARTLRSLNRAPRVARVRGPWGARASGHGALPTPLQFFTVVIRRSLVLHLIQRSREEYNRNGHGH